MHENSHPRFQLPAGQSHVKSGSATPRRPLSSPPGHVEPWSRVAVAVISVLRCHRRTPPRTAVSTSALHVGPSADRSLARSCRGAPCSPWGRTPWAEGHRSRPTGGRAAGARAVRWQSLPGRPSAGRLVLRLRPEPLPSWSIRGRQHRITRTHARAQTRGGPAGARTPRGLLSAGGTSPPCRLPPGLFPFPGLFGAPTWPGRAAHV